MDTSKDSAVADVPPFTVARVGKGRKKGGAFSFLRGGGGAGRGAWNGVGVGGGGAAGIGGGSVAVLGFNLSKAVLILLISAGGLGAVGLGRMVGNASHDGAKKSKPKAFSMAREPIKIEGDTSNLPATANTIPNSLGYLSGSVDGLTPEERAKKAADAAAAAEAQRIADEEAAKKAEADNLAAKPAEDPAAALLAAAQADGGKGGGGGAFGKKFGVLSSGSGGGSALAGGAGMSGGMNQKFASSGSLGKGAAGQLSASRGGGRVTSSRASRAAVGKSNLKGFARRQLSGANALSRRGAAAGKGETSASDAGTAFDNNPSAGNVISGPGLGDGSAKSGAADNTPNPGSGGPTGGGAPADNCGEGQYMDENGSCRTTSTTSGKNVTPWQWMADLATGLLAAIAVLAVLAMIFEDAVVTYELAAVLNGLIGALGVVVGLLGIAIIAMGDYFQGTIFTLVGAFIGMTAFAPSVLKVTLTMPALIVTAGAGALAGMAAKNLDS